MNAKTLLEIASDCKHAGKRNAARVKVSTVCGERGRRVAVFDCANYSAPATIRRYAVNQAELICIRCPLVLAHFGADSK